MSSKVAWLLLGVAVVAAAVMAEAPAAGATTADLAVTKVAERDPARVGKKLEYTITVTNASPGTATGVVLTEQFQVNGGVAPGDPPSLSGSC